MRCQGGLGGGGGGVRAGKAEHPEKSGLSPDPGGSLRTGPTQRITCSSCCRLGGGTLRAPTNRLSGSFFHRATGAPNRDRAA